MSTAKEAILARIRQAGTGMAAQAPVAYGEIERSYQSAAALTREQILDLLEERLVEYDAHVYRVAEGEIPGITARLLAERKIARVVVPAGLPPSWVSSAKQGAEFVKDTGFDAATLNGFGGVMTGSTLAMAETGTIVLQDVPGQGRRAITLVPDYHLCVVRE